MQQAKAAALAVLISIACYTFTQVKDAECKIYCKTSAGYDSGVYTSGKCWCADKIKQERFEQKRAVIPSSNFKKESL